MIVRRRIRIPINGFTLVELVVVVLLLGILGAIAIPKMFGTSREAKLASTMRDYSVIVDAAAQYRAVHGEWPSLTKASGAPGDFEGYLDGRVFEKKVPMGSRPSRWIWNRDILTYKAVLYYCDPDKPVELWQELDDQYDDGDLETGVIRRYANNYLIFVVSEDETAEGGGKESNKDLK